MQAIRIFSADIRNFAGWVSFEISQKSGELAHICKIGFFPNSGYGS